MGLLSYLQRQSVIDEQRAAREQYKSLLGTPEQTALAPQEGPVRPGEFLPPITQTTEGTGLLGGQVSPQEVMLRTAGMAGQPGTQALAGLLSQKGASAAKQTEKLFKNAKALRGEFTKVTKNFADINDSYGRIKISAKDPSPAGDLSLIFNYMKMLDPESVVRESEFATAAATGSMGERIKAITAKIVSGKKLSDNQREDFVDRSHKLFKEASRIHGGRVKEFTTKSGQFGIDPSTVIFQRQFHSLDRGKPKKIRKYNPKTGKIE